jgi:hypothetical protein
MKVYKLRFVTFEPQKFCLHYSQLRYSGKPVAINTVMNAGIMLPTSYKLLLNILLTRLTLYVLVTVTGL